MSVEKESPTCPFCDGKHVELYSSFGTAQLVRQYYCLNCKTFFKKYTMERFFLLIDLMSQPI
ncbi:hypothetical protein [Peribacillus simplex]|uniref:PaaD-like zinc ribbon domain-containing protein n=1 Tax=Peribacillus simplex TaxID=1478 RepID=UPI003D2B68E6